MGFQIGASLLDACVLAVLDRRDVYGYELTVNIKSIIEISESTLYPILRRLEAAGSLTVRSAEHNGRLRKMYYITEQGRRQLAEFISDWNELAAVYDFIRGGMEP